MKLTSIAGTLGKIIGVLIIIVWVWLPFYAFYRQLKFEREAVRVINAHAAAIDDHAKSLRITAYLLNGGTNRQGEVLGWNPTGSNIKNVGAYSTPPGINTNYQKSLDPMPLTPAKP